MTRPAYTRHGLARLRQRGFLPDDADLIMAYGSEVEDGFVMLHRDQDEAISHLKSLVSRVEKLEGARMVCRDGVVVTAYRATSRQIRSLLKPRR